MLLLETNGTLMLLLEYHVSITLVLLIVKSGTDYKSKNALWELKSKTTQTLTTLYISTFVETGLTAMNLLLQWQTTRWLIRTSQIKAMWECAVLLPLQILLETGLLI